MNPTNNMPALARNDPDGNITCLLCGWRGRGAHMEEIEFMVGRHLREAHGLRLLFRVCNEDGTVTTVPQGEMGGNG